MGKPPPMAKFVLDTNLYISKRFTPNNLPETTYYSSVVLFELMTACNDLREFRAYQLVWNLAEKDGLLIVPNEKDWLRASRISFNLSQERKQQSGGKAPKLSSKVKQEILMDCLLAVSVAREGAVLLTLNHKDFDYIRRHCKNLQVQEYPTK
jgi:predicted nucleic acid-binding protein